MTESERKEEKALPDHEPLAWYPVLATAIPVLALFSSNLGLFQLHEVIRPFFIALMLGAILWGLGSFAFGDQQRGAAAALVVVGCLWGFSFANRLVGGFVGPQAGMILVLLLALGAAVLAAKWGPKPNFLNAAATILTLLIVGRTAFSLAFPPKSKGLDAAKVEPLPPGPRPDIFFIICDGFGRLDVLKEKHGIDLAWFKTALEERGFSVVEGSRASYIQTQLSLSSTLNLAYLPDLINPNQVDKEKRAFRALMENSIAAKKLEASGYEHVSIGTGFDGVRFGGKTLPLAKTSAVNLFEGNLLQKTPFGLLPWVDESQRSRHRTFIKGALAQIADQTGTQDKPLFVTAHLLAPHPPFVFKPDGSDFNPKEKFAVSDADDYMERVAGPTDYREGYSNNVQFVAKSLIEAIDAVMAKHQGRPPVILIQGDHGPKLGVSHKSLSGTDVSEGFPNLYAFYSPDGVDLQVPAGDSPVNTFRRLFSAMGAKGLSPLPAKSFYSTTAKPLDLTDVSGQVP